jgi:hypothetical protein
MQSITTDIFVCVKITLSIADDIVLKVRPYADRLGTSVNQLVRDYLQELAGKPDFIRDADEFRRLSRMSHGNSRQWKFNKEDAHQRSSELVHHGVKK